MGLYFGGTGDKTSRYNKVISNSLSDYLAKSNKFKIPEGTLSLGENCFSGWDKLTTIDIPDSVTSLGDSCFYGCSSLKRIAPQRR